MNFHKSLIIVLLSLVLLPVLCFGPILSHVGFYLDDWIALRLLHFAPGGSSYFDLVHYYLFSDSRVLMRPLEALHFATVYYFCHDNPIGWHLVNFLFEIAAAWLLYSVSFRLTGKRAAAFCGALLLLIYPSHDSTHYWVVSSSVALSLTLYLASLASSLQATDAYFAGRKTRCGLWQLSSFTLFLLSLLNYETLLPLAALSALASLALAYRQTGRMKAALLQGALTSLPLILALVALLFFQKIIVPALGHGYTHAFKLDPAVMLSVIVRGVILNAPPEAIQFFFSQAKAAAVCLTSSEIVRLVALVVVATAVAGYLARVDRGEKPRPDQPVNLKPVDLAVLGLIVIFVSYTIFGLSGEYMPTFITMVNRVNTGASVGVALIIVALCQALETFCRSRRPAYMVPMALAVAACVTLFTLADWGLARPWIVSWTAQKQVRQSISQLKGKVDPKASILLISCPRYVMWSPVFDGVWDFESMARITLELPSFNANVVSERLSLSPRAIKDVSYGYECGSYPFDKLYLMVAPHPELVPVRTGKEFVDLVEQRGMTFGLDKKTLSKWRREASLTAKLETSH